MTKSRKGAGPCPPRDWHKKTQNEPPPTVFSNSTHGNSTVQMLRPDTGGTFDLSFFLTPTPSNPFVNPLSSVFKMYCKSHHFSPPPSQPSGHPPLSLRLLQWPAHWSPASSFALFPSTPLKDPVKTKALLSSKVSLVPLGWLRPQKRKTVSVGKDMGQPKPS